jgi:hypothetical protein
VAALVIPTDGSRQKCACALLMARTGDPR